MKKPRCKEHDVPLVCPVCVASSGGEARARSLTAKKRKVIAIKAANARWANEPKTPKTITAIVRDVTRPPRTITVKSIETTKRIEVPFYRVPKPDSSEK